MNQDGSEFPDTPLERCGAVAQDRGRLAPEISVLLGPPGLNAAKRTGKHVLSQWWESAFEIGGICYPTAEHYMMAEKARLFGDDAILPEILEAPSPAPPRRWAAG